MCSSTLHTVVGRVIEQVSKFIVGHERNLELIMSAILARGHILILGYPGSAKTLTAKLVAEALGLKFKRIQMASDVLPADIIGTKIVDPKTGSLRTVKGPIFANIVLVDELNRANPKTQAALLEAMQEYQVTIEGETYKLPQPFTVIATLNPVETQGIFPLPHAQLDRFMISLDFEYPAEDEEIEILKRDHMLKGLEPRVEPIVAPNELAKAIDEASSTHISQDVLKYIVNIVRALREDSAVYLGPSPRASVMIMRMAKSIAAIRGRTYVIPDDVKYVAPYVLRHRIVLKGKYTANLWECIRDSERKVREVLNRIPTPW